MPLEVPPWWTSRHFPWTRTVPSGSVVHCWAAVPLQPDTSTAVPLPVAFPLSSMQSTGISDDTGPAGGVHAWFLCPLHDPTTTRVPLALLEPGSARHMPAAGLSRVIGIAPSAGLMLRG